MPWANGGGSTRRLWSDAAGERRISVAMLARPTSFSALTDIARLLVVLDPVVIRLSIGNDRRTLRQYDAVAFAGDDPVALIEVDRPGRVLNLMSRADRWRPSIDRALPASVGWIAMPAGDLIVGEDPAPTGIVAHFLRLERPAPIS